MQIGREHFFADSGASAGKYLNLLDNLSWIWSVSYKKWTEMLDTLASEMQQEWIAMRNAVGRKGDAGHEQYGWIKHLPGEACERVQAIAVVRCQAADRGDLLWRYAYVVGGGELQKTGFTSRMRHDLFSSNTGSREPRGNDSITFLAT